MRRSFRSSIPLREAEAPHELGRAQPDAVFRERLQRYMLRKSSLHAVAQQTQRRRLGGENHDAVFPAANRVDDALGNLEGKAVAERTANPDPGMLYVPDWPVNG